MPQVPSSLTDTINSRCKALAPTKPLFTTEAEQLTRSLHQLLDNNIQDGQSSLQSCRHLPGRLGQEGADPG